MSEVQAGVAGRKFVVVDEEFLGMRGRDGAAVEVVLAAVLVVLAAVRVAAHRLLAVEELVGVEWTCPAE